MSVDVLGLGAAAMDIVMQCEDLPKEDGFAFIHEEKLLPGGSCANVLVTLAHLRTKAGMVAQIGDDHYGTAFKQNLNEEGVSTEHLLIKKNGITLHTFISVARLGAKSIYAHMGDSLLTLSEDDVNPQMLQGVKVFYTDMFPGKPALKLAKLCKSAGIPIVFNLQCAVSFMELCAVTRKDIEEMLSVCDLFVSGRDGIPGLTGSANYIEANRIIYDKFNLPLGVITTWGDKGAYWHSREGEAKAPSFKVDAVDTTGAGDAFIGGLIHSYFIRGNSRQDSIEFANARAAINCTKIGARVKATAEDVKNFMELYK